MNIPKGEFSRRQLVLKLNRENAVDIGDGEFEVASQTDRSVTHYKLGGRSYTVFQRGDLKGKWTRQSYRYKQTNYLKRKNGS